MSDTEKAEHLAQRMANASQRPLSVDGTLYGSNNVPGALRPYADALIEAADVLDDLLDHAPIVGSLFSGSYCRHCHGPSAISISDIQHEPDCDWGRARAVLASLRSAPDHLRGKEELILEAHADSRGPTREDAER